MLKILGHQETANQNHTEIPSHLRQNGYLSYFERMAILKSTTTTVPRNRASTRSIWICLRLWVLAQQKAAILSFPSLQFFLSETD